MSVKAMGMVWDLECPKEYNGIEFRPSHKFTLLAYADHADHHGKNIFPAVSTVSKKTGLDERTTQRLTRDLTAMGIMVPDGQGPRGTNRFLLSYDDRGWHPVTLSQSQGDKNQNSLGDNSSGDIPSGDNQPPEFKEPEPINLSDSEKIWNQVVEIIKQDNPKSYTAFTKLETARPVSFDKSIFTVGVPDIATRDWLDDRLGKTINNIFPGLKMSDVQVSFVVLENIE